MTSHSVYVSRDRSTVYSPFQIGAVCKGRRCVVLIGGSHLITIRTPKLYRSALTKARFALCTHEVHEVRCTKDTSTAPATGPETAAALISMEIDLHRENIGLISTLSRPSH